MKRPKIYLFVTSHSFFIAKSFKRTLLLLAFLLIFQSREVTSKGLLQKSVCIISLPFTVHNRFVSIASALQQLKHYNSKNVIHNSKTALKR